MKQTLNGLWKMQRIGEEVSYDAKVPTTMYKVLYDNGVIEDPFYGENDLKQLKLSDDDYVFYRSFSMTKDEYDSELIELEFLGLDTLATICINDQLVKKTDNMHRTYVIDIKQYVKPGENTIEVLFNSPTKFIADEYAKDPIWGIETTIDGYEHLRKAHHMFGWDWGPQLPDMGIWRDVNLYFISEGKIDDIYIEQIHSGIDPVTFEEEAVTLKMQLSAIALADDMTAEVCLKDKEGNVVASGAFESMSDFEKDGNIAVVFDDDNDLYSTSIEVKNPKLWWPNGYGESYLYNLVVELKCGETVVDTLTKRIGLRTMTVTREPDAWGETFDYTINGARIFAMGADYIPEDALITRPTYESTERLVKDCARANYNCLRVWGGGLYPSDDLFDLCDEYGLIIWEDFMFACGVYRLTDKFKENITEEFIDNIRRLRHHASLGLWCGNNEMEWGFVEWGIPEDERLRMDYLLMYEKLIPDVLAVYDPNTFYWPASPSSGGGFLKPNDDNKGDVHYWNVFHGNEHYKEFRNHYFKFASEYGMQAFPDWKTIKSYAADDQMNSFSPVMENHNKCIKPMNGNIKILLNMAGEFKMPTTFEEQVYISQVFQGETIKCAVEHFRRNRGRCMGSTYWQVNDNYPVASWASIDVYGRWKAMHYMAKRFYEPLLLSAYEEGLIGHIHFTNDTLYDFDGSCKWQIRHVDKGILEEGVEAIHSKALSPMHVVDVDVEKYVTKFAGERDIYLAYQLVDGNGLELASETILFTYHKYFNFKEAKVEVNVVKEGNDYFIELESAEYVKSIGIEFKEADGILCKNYFDLLPGVKARVKVEEWYANEPSDVAELKEQITVKSVGSLAY